MPRISNPSSQNFTWKVSNDEFKHFPAPSSHQNLMTSSYHNDSIYSSYRVTPDQLTIKTNMGDRSTKMTSRSADPSPQGFLTKSDYREISPRPFESAFKSAIEKMKHSSATRLDMVGHQDRNQGKWSGNRVIFRNSNHTDPKLTMSQNYVPSDTMSDCGVDSTSQENIFPNYKPFSPMKGMDAQYTLPRNRDNFNRYLNKNASSFETDFTMRPAKQSQSYAEPKGTIQPSKEMMQSEYISPVNKTSQRYSSDVSLNSSNFWDLKRQNRGSHDQNGHWSYHSQNNSSSYQHQPRKITSVSIRSASTGRLDQNEEVLSARTVDNTGIDDTELPLPSVKDIIMKVEALHDKENKSARINVIQRPRINKSEFVTPKYQQQRFSTNPSVRNQQYQQMQHSNYTSNQTTSNQKNSLKSWNQSNQLSPMAPLRQRDNYSPMKRAEQLSNLPLDYQKLRESFLEQRNEIQRLRKEISDKNVLIQSLQKDLKLYEPWRFTEEDQL